MAGVSRHFCLPIRTALSLSPLRRGRLGGRRRTSADIWQRPSLMTGWDGGSLRQNAPAWRTRRAARRWRLGCWRARVNTALAADCTYRRITSLPTITPACSLTSSTCLRHHTLPYHLCLSALPSLPGDMCVSYHSAASCMGMSVGVSRLAIAMTAGERAHGTTADDGGRKRTEAA